MEMLPCPFFKGRMSFYEFVPSDSLCPNDSLYVLMIHHLSSRSCCTSLSLLNSNHFPHRSRLNFVSFPGIVHIVSFSFRCRSIFFYILLLLSLARAKPGCERRLRESKDFLKIFWQCLVAWFFSFLSFFPLTRWRIRVCVMISVRQPWQHF